MSRILSTKLTTFRLSILKTYTRCANPVCFASNFNRFLHYKPSEKSWAQAIQTAEETCSVDASQIINPKVLVGQDIDFLTENIKSVLTSGHPVINTISNYYFESGGKHVRPLVVLLMSQATSLVPKDSNIFSQDINQPISNIFAKGGQRQQDDFGFHAEPPTLEIYPKTSDGCFITPSQRRLAEISEMIHTASLFHDDVIDDSQMRRGVASCNSKFGNKMAILGGDFLLARSSMALARLGNLEVVELLATVISNLVEGELLQIKDAQPTKGNTKTNIFDFYIEKSYLKTASLIANSSKAAAILGNSPPTVSQIAFEYGKSLGIAFQLIDDMLDFVVSCDEFGKPVGADLELGLTTAPVLFAWEEFPELGPLIERKFNQEGDVQKVRDLVYKSQGLSRTKALAIEHCDNAVNEISKLPPSRSREALIQLCQKVIERKK